MEEKKNAEVIASNITNDSVKDGVAEYAEKNSGYTIRSDESWLWICW